MRPQGGSEPQGCKSAREEKRLERSCRSSKCEGLLHDSWEWGHGRSGVASLTVESVQDRSTSTLARSAGRQQGFEHRCKDSGKSVLAEAVLRAPAESMEAFSSPAE